MKHNCDLCGERGTRDDPVVEYILQNPPRGWAHIECATEEGWED